MAENDPVPVFSVIGDSNVHPHVNKTSCRANPQLKAAQILKCGTMERFHDVLSSVREMSSICIVACLTNFVSSASGPATISHRVDPVLQDFRGELLDACETNPNRLYFVSPPMYRTNPVWYREGLPEILTLFSSVLSCDRPDNLRILPSFPTPEFESDGVHLTAYSGLEYILHLFDASHEILALLDTAPEIAAIKSSESTRVLEDRVMALEQDHRRLNKVVEKKTAADAELSDFHANERTEDSFVICGLAYIPDLVGKAWQDKAVQDVQDVLKVLMGREFNIIFVKNATSRVKDAEITYNVRLSSIPESSQIRKKFGSFYLGGKDARPDDLKHINIKNLVTPETRTRISVLKLLAKRYRDSNPGSKVQVISFDPRPLLKITPSPTASDRRIMIFNYVEAVQKLPCNFSAEEVAPIIRRLNPKLLGQVRSLFVVLSDDQFREQLRKYESKKSNPESARSQPSPDQGSEDGSQTNAASGSSGVAPGSSSASGGRGSSSSSTRGVFARRNSKRGPPSELSGSAKK